MAYNRHMAAKLLDIRLFIEGVELPVTSVSVSAGIMQPAVANIQIPATDEAHGLKPRSLVHVFYFDNSRKIGLSISKDDEQGSSDVALPTDNVRTNPESWKLLFTGETHGYSFTKHHGKRFINLVAKDHTAYWDDAKLYWGTGGWIGRRFQRAVFMGATRARTGKSVVNTSKELIDILQAKPATVPTLQGLLGGAVHLLESIAGVYYGDKKYRGLNDFLSVGELRLKLTKQIGVSPFDTSSQNLTGSYEFRRYIRAMTRQFRATASYRQILNVLLDRVFHTYSSVLCPAYIHKGATARYLRLVPASKGFPASVKAILKEVDGITDTAYASVTDRDKNTAGRGTKDNAQFVVKGAVSVPDTEGQKAWKKEWVKKVATSDRTSALKAKAEAIPLSKGFNRRQKRELLTKIDYATKGVGVVHSDLMGETTKVPLNESQFPYHNEKSLKEAAIALENAQKKLSGSKYKTVSGTLELTDRLNTTLFSPLIWMCPPPKCNVFFPDQYTQVSFSRQWMSEVSRMWLHGLYWNGKANYHQSYFAPSTEILTGNTSMDEMREAALAKTSFLLKHEVFTGIVPSIQGLGNAAALKKLNTIVERKEGRKSIFSFGEKSPALARAASAKFLLERFRPRQLSIQGPFNAGVVCGVPGLVLDPILSASGLGEGAVAKGTHFVGLVTGVQHTIHQGGATTTTNMAFCRAHNEGLDLFGDKKGAKLRVKKSLSSGGTKVRARKEILAEVHGWSLRSKRVKRKGRWTTETILVPKLGMMGHSGTSGRHITKGLAHQEVASDTSMSKKRRPVDVGPATPGLENARQYRKAHYVKPKKFRKADTKVDNKSTWTESTDAVPTAITRSPTYFNGYKYYPKKPWMTSANVKGAIVVDAYEVALKPGNRSKFFEFSFEQIARPPWFSDIYLNKNIGNEFYQQLIGCGSITDPTAIFGAPTKSGNESRVGTWQMDPQYITDIANNDIKTKNKKGANEILEELLNDPDTKRSGKVVMELPDGTEMDVPVKLIGGKTVEESVEEIAASYQRTVKEDIDSAAFVRMFGRRKHASLIDIFGYGYKAGVVGPSSSEAKGIVGARFVKQLPEYDPLGKLSQPTKHAKEGFHSKAFGDLTNLQFLDATALQSHKSVKTRKIDPRADPRKERYEAVLAYLESLRTKAET